MLIYKTFPFVGHMFNMDFPKLRVQSIHIPQTIPNLKTFRTFLGLPSGFPHRFHQTNFFHLVLHHLFFAKPLQNNSFYHKHSLLCCTSAKHTHFWYGPEHVLPHILLQCHITSVQSTVVQNLRFTAVIHQRECYLWYTVKC